MTRRLLISVVALVGAALIGCASASESTSRAEAAQATAVTDDAAPRARLTVSVARPDLEGSGTSRLVAGWYTLEEYKAREAHTLPIAHLLTLLHRLRVVTIDLDAPTSGGLLADVDLDVPEGVAVVPFAVLDVHRTFWTAWFGGAYGETPWGRGGPVTVEGGIAAVEVKLEERLPLRSSEERCVEERMVLVDIDAPGVQGRAPWENPTKQKVCVYLPASYERAKDRRYPVIYMLPGLFSDHMSKLGKGGGIQGLVDASGKEAILVGVDGRTATGSSYFVDAPINGAWLTYLSETVVSTVDARFRTIPDGRARGLLGQSTGGFNAVAVAMRRPTVFGAAVASAPDGLDLERWLFPDGERADPDWLAWLRMDDALLAPGQMISYAAAFSPDPESDTGFVWPLDPATGRKHEPALARWRASSPYGMLDDEATLAGVRAHLSGRLFIEAGADDEFKLAPPAERFSKKLEALGVEHYFRLSPGGHLDSRPRLERTVPMLLDVLTPADG